MSLRAILLPVFTLFFCAGAIYVAAHKKNISDMSGLGRTMPFTLVVA